ncbi:hypothetical protein ABIB37_002023 [Agrococcus sp. UYP10]|uniref:HNH endonuclease signature motif containing protein n=1 Tax=Agrococcus sp. UYP10 TaxID=1756355 RepID=UPI003396C00F
MDDWGIDGEGYIAAIRAGAIDPFGRTADELQAELDAHDEEWAERLIAMTPAELDAVVEGRMEVPQLPRPAESEPMRRLRLEEQFAGRVKALEAQRARLEAEEREMLAARLDRVRADGGEVSTGLREAASILAVELRQSDRGIEQRMSAAWTIVHELPLAHAAHKAGRISGGHLRVIEQETRAVRVDDGVDQEQAARVEAELVAIAEDTSPSRLRSRAKLVVNRVLTAPLQQRHDDAREQREVHLVDASNGMVFLGGYFPALPGTAAFNRLTDAARRKPKDDPRTFDQFRADAFLELLLSGVSPEDLHEVSAITATVTVTVPATELLGDPDDPDVPQLRFPALLDGRILVDSATIRSLAAETVTWERLFLHPVTGMPVTVDTYTPNRAQRRALRARDGHCRWPGCSNPVHRADLDHTQDWAKGGTTTIGNLAHLCRRHHVMKHSTRWTVRQLPGGVLEWTSPLGRIIRDEPEPQGPVFVERDPIWGLPVTAATGPPGDPPPF